MTELYSINGDGSGDSEDRYVITVTYSTEVSSLQYDGDLKRIVEGEPKMTYIADKHVDCLGIAQSPYYLIVVAGDNQYLYNHDNVVKLTMEKT